MTSFAGCVIVLCLKYTRCLHSFQSSLKLISPPSEPSGEIMSFGVSSVNYSDSDRSLNTLNDITILGLTGAGLTGMHVNSNIRWGLLKSLNFRNHFKVFSPVYKAV